MLPTIGDPQSTKRAVHAPSWQHRLMAEWRRLLRLPRAFGIATSVPIVRKGHLPTTARESKTLEAADIREALRQIRIQRERFFIDRPRKTRSLLHRVQRASTNGSKRIPAVPADRMKTASRRIRSEKPLMFSFGGRGRVTAKYLAEIGLSPMALREKPIVITPAETLNREKFAIDVREQILLDLRDLLEESR
jgi:hypothetical protein